ncbi:cupin domain-containing protein [soil metagenome]
MTDAPAPKPLWTAAEITAAPSHTLSHPWNPKSDIHIVPLAMMAGLQRAQLSLARVPPGKESFAYHFHEHDEEFIFILSGRGRTEIGGAIYEVGPGDFMGFPALGPPHHMTNPYEEDLVYFMGGERSGLDIGHFPRLGRRMIFGPSGIVAMEETALTPMSFADYAKKE